MTQEEIDTMKATDGVYICGSLEHPNYTQLVGVVGGSLRAIRFTDELVGCVLEWPSSLHLVAGPLTVQNQRDLNEKATRVAEEVMILDHDFSICRGLLQSARRYVALCSRLGQYLPKTAALAKALLEAIDRTSKKPTQPVP